VAQYDGNYRGSYGGSFGGGPTSGPVSYSVSNGRITLIEPGDGSGTVDVSGSTSIAGRLNFGFGVDCMFSGTFQIGSASGPWSCAGGGQTGTGTWMVQRQ
jgi:hypothetical protein